MLPQPHILGEAPREEAEPASPIPVSGADPGPAPGLPPEIGGREGPEPTRYGDWEKSGRCIDF